MEHSIAAQWNQIRVDSSFGGKCECQMFTERCSGNVVEQSKVDLAPW